MSDSESEDVPAKRKKGKVNKHLLTREMEKLARRRGYEFDTKEGTLVEAKITGPDCQCNFSLSFGRPQVNIVNMFYLRRT